MSKKTFIFATLLILAIILGGAVWVAKEKSNKVALEKAKQEEMVKKAAQQAVSDANFVKYNKVLSRDKITGVQDLEGQYKKVTVSNGEVTFSFEVPDKWLTETRNSGEVTMNEGELREFIKTYGDFNKNEDVDKLSLKEMQEYFNFNGSHGDNEFSPGLPNVTVSSGMKKAIWYIDIGWDQVDFYIVSKQDGSRYLENNRRGLEKELKNQEPKFRDKLETKWENQIIDGRKSLVSIYPKDFNEKTGEYMVTRGGTGGRKYYIEVNDTYTLIIWKEAYVEGEFEDGFKHLIDTLSFE
ncbi:MAG: hypothetical protein WBC29_01390 [Candidatus Moraniibacteriota bacterium]